MPLPLSAKILTTAFAASGILHLVRPRTFEPLMPDWVPKHREMILASGVAEIACALGMSVAATRRPAGWVSAALLLTVWPGNLQMAIDSNTTSSTAWKAISWGRLPLQVPMIRIAVSVARSGH